jgi:polyhydroxybutyrate depolymerase
MMKWRETEHCSIVVDGIERTYLLCGREAAAGIVLCLHGTTKTADQLARFSGMAKLRSEGFVVVFPQAVLPALRGYEWDHERDLGYLTAVINRVRADFGNSSSPVFLAGSSGGARMACYYAAAHAEEITAVAAVAGVRAPHTTPARRVAVLAFHGLADRRNPYPGGHEERWMESVPDAALSWATANDVADTKRSSEESPTLTRITYGAATPGEVTLWTFREAGHTWPGHPVGFFLRRRYGQPKPRRGETSNELDATDEISEFFRKIGARALQEP